MNHNHNHNHVYNIFHSCTTLNHLQIWLYNMYISLYIICISYITCTIIHIHNYSNPSCKKSTSGNVIQYNLQLYNMLLNYIKSEIKLNCWWICCLLNELSISSEKFYSAKLGVLIVVVIWAICLIKHFQNQDFAPDIAGVYQKPLNHLTS